MCAIIEYQWKVCKHTGVKYPPDIRICHSEHCVGMTHQAEEVEGKCSDCLTREKDHNPQATEDERERQKKQGEKDKKKSKK